MELINSTVLDLCAGTGALGIEALSRGAKSAVFIEPNREVHRALESNLSMLGAKMANVALSDAETYLTTPTPDLFDLVFVDPPFSENAHTSLCDRLEASGKLSENAIIYVESPAKSDFSLPETWKELKNKTMGAVNCRLLTRDCGN